MNPCYKLEWIWPKQKNKTLVECVCKNSRNLICLTNQLAILPELQARSLVDASLPTLSHCFSLRPNFPCWKFQWIFLNTNFLNFKYLALSCFGHALHLLLESLNLSTIGSKSVISRYKKKPSWWSYCLFTEETLLFLHEPLIICPPIPFQLQSSLEYYLPYLTAVAVAHHSSMNTPRIDYSPSFRRVFMGR